MCGTRYPRPLRKSTAAGPEVSKRLLAEAVSLTVNTAADTMGSGRVVAVLGTGQVTR